MTLTSDIVCRIIVSRTYLLYDLRWESQICCMDTSFDADVSHTILGHCDLDHDLVSRIIMSGAYHLYSRCSIDSGTCYQVNRMSTQTWHVVE